MSIAADKVKRPLGLAGRALAWWLGELAALYREAARRLELSSRNATILEAGERYWLLRRRQRPVGQVDCAALDAAQIDAALARMVPHGAPLILEIPQERTLTKRLMLPALARGELDRILCFEIARHFPFPVERVHFGHRVLGSGGAAGSIEVEIAAVPRELVAELCDALARAGLRPSAICLAGTADVPPLFLPIAAIKKNTRRGDHWLAMLLAALALASIVSPIAHDRMRLAAVEREVAALKPRAQAVIDARARQRRDTAETAGLLRLEAARPPLVVLLDGLTKAVPDGAWLQSLRILGREAVMDGMAPSAASVALALEQSHIVANVVFRAPIARDPKTGLEHFQFAAAILEPKP
jgi:general secretion pathway protein L